MFGLWGKKDQSKKNSQSAYEKVLPRVSVKQEQVLQAIQNLQPCHYRQVSHHLHTIEGCVTPRIAELKRKGLIKVAFVQKNHFSGTRVNHYEVTGAGMKHLIERMGEI